MARNPLPCPVCGAVLGLDPADVDRHLKWHASTTTLDGWTVAGATFALQSGWEDDAPTAKLPPVRETVLRRPPPPEVRDLKGAELLRALADAIADDPELDGETL